MVVKRELGATTHDQLETTIVHLVEIGYHRKWCVNHQGKGKPLSKGFQLSHDGQEWDALLDIYVTKQPWYSGSSPSLRCMTNQ